jgi:hypothetical protein
MESALACKRLALKPHNVDVPRVRTQYTSDLELGLHLCSTCNTALVALSQCLSANCATLHWRQESISVEGQQPAHPPAPVPLKDEETKKDPPACCRNHAEVLHGCTRMGVGHSAEMHTHPAISAASLHDTSCTAQWFTDNGMYRTRPPQSMQKGLWGTASKRRQLIQETHYRGISAPGTQMTLR